MKFPLQNNSHSNISFTTNAKVSVRGEHSYTVKWFRDKEFIGDMNLGGGNWGAFPNEIGNWVIEFWQEDICVQSIDFNLEGKNILILPIFAFQRSENFDIDLKVLKMNDDLDFNIIIEKEF